ncbi:MAG: TetR/AcrR family transcriptional regulator [Anaerolineae bacterium]|nr:TetR/AcrR family transcriptional regulator [Anaerolineae bacterium]
MSPRTPEQYARIRREREQQILGVARRLFARHGFHRTKVSDIARAAGVSQGTMYHYFASKDELFMAMFSTWAEQLEHAVRGLPESPMSAPDTLRVMVRVAEAFFVADADLLPVFVEFCAYALHNPKAAASFNQLFQAMQRSIARILEDGVAEGSFRPIDAQALSALPLVILDGVILLAPILGAQVLPGRFLEQTLQLVLDGLLVEAEG